MKKSNACSMHVIRQKRIREMLPPLPEGIMSSHIRYMDMIQELQKQKVHVRVSDLSDVLNIPRPVSQGQ